MQRINESLAISNNNEKVKILTERFSPQLALANLSNITSETPATHLRVNNDMTTKEMAKTISHLLNNTALRLDKIPNKALKTYRPLITLWLADVTKAYFIIGYYLRFGKAITTIVLHKESKADYLLLRSYCPIALKNTLNKILKRVIAKHITNTVKKYVLLL